MDAFDLIRQFEKACYFYYNGCYMGNNIWGIKFSDEDYTINPKPQNSFLIVSDYNPHDDTTTYSCQLVNKRKLIREQLHISLKELEIEIDYVLDLIDNIKGLKN